MSKPHDMRLLVFECIYLGFFKHLFCWFASVLFKDLTGFEAKTKESNMLDKNI